MFRAKAPAAPPRPEVAAASDPPTGPARPPAFDPPPHSAAASTPRARFRRRRPAAVGAALGMAALLVGLAIAWGAARSGEPDGTAVPAAAERPEGAFRGSLVYAATDEDGDGRLMVWDPATAAVAIGTRIENVVDLVRIETNEYQGIGVTRVSERGRRRALVLTAGTGRFLSRPVVTGDLVAWGPDGLSVAAANRGREVGRCRRNASIVVANLERRTAERVFRSRLCGELVSLGRARARTFVSLVETRGVTTYFAGLDRLHLEVAGSILVSVAPSGELLIAPTDGPALSRLPPVRARAGGHLAAAPAATDGTLLHWSGRGGPATIGDAVDDLYVEHVLAWSRNGLRALVVGHLGPVNGVYVVEGGFGGSRRVPELLTPVSGPVTGGAFGPRGEIALAMGGELLVGSGAGDLAPQRLPDDAPEPAGPILWLP